MGRKAISTRYLLRVDTGFLVRKCWEWTGFSLGERYELGRVRDELGVRLIFSPSLNDLPEKRTKSELFAGFSHHV